jgi:mannose-6-phosphate isomerase-like protein (cupin superfamily)
MAKDDTTKLALTDCMKALVAGPHPYATCFERDDARLVLYAPKGEDLQTPHTQDELYIVISGHGRLRRKDEVVDFKPGDVLFVAAREDHKFIEFSDDFSTWAIFWGEKHPA